MARRIFIAAEIDEVARDAIFRLVSKIFCGHDEIIRITPPENLHITMKFIGDTDNKKIEEIINIMSDVVSSCRNFKYTLESHMGAFPHVGRARIAYIGIEEGKRRFEDLYSSLDKGLAVIGIKEESRSFKPHITAVRIKKPLNIEKTISAPLSFKKTAFQLKSLTLFESILTGHGSKYINIEKFVLK